MVNPIIKTAATGTALVALGIAAVKYSLDAMSAAGLKANNTLAWLVFTPAVPAMVTGGLLLLVAGQRAREWYDAGQQASQSYR